MKEHSFRFRLIPSLWVAWTVLTSCALKSQQFYDNGVSDEEYVSIARQHRDAQAFLGEFPLAETYVDRSGSLAVDFRVSKRPLIGTTQPWEGIRLRVFISSRTNQPTRTLIQCDSRFVDSNVRQYLEQYIKTQTCP